MNKRRIFAIAAAAAAVCVAAGLILFLTHASGPRKAPAAAVPASQSTAQLKKSPLRSFVNPGCCNDASSNKNPPE